jgi:CubicO group peptidase (beta-lactamase class C family)
MALGCSLRQSGEPVTGRYLQTRQAPSTDSHLWFSMSKIATATPAMTQAEAGPRSRCPIRDYVSGYPTSSVPLQSTIRQLLNHTASSANPPDRSGRSGLRSLDRR